MKNIYFIIAFLFCVAVGFGQGTTQTSTTSEYKLYKVSVRWKFVPIIDTIYFSDTLRHPELKGDTGLLIAIDRLLEAQSTLIGIYDFGNRTSLQIRQSYVDDNTWVAKYHVSWDMKYPLNRAMEELRHGSLLFERYLSQKVNELMWLYDRGYFPRTDNDK